MTVEGDREVSPAVAGVVLDPQRRARRVGEGEQHRERGSRQLFGRSEWFGLRHETGEAAQPEPARAGSGAHDRTAKRRHVSPLR